MTMSNEHPTADHPGADLLRQKLRYIGAYLLPESPYQGVTTGLEHVLWLYRALPELDLADINLSYIRSGPDAALCLGTAGGAVRGRI